MSPTSANSSRLFIDGCTVGSSTGEADSNDDWLNTGRSSTEPEPTGLAAGLPPVVSPR